MFVIASLTDPRRPWFHHRTFDNYGEALEVATKINLRRKNHGMPLASVFALSPTEMFQ